MPRQPRIVVPGLAHHITQRGNYRQDVFSSKQDYIQYCEWIEEYAQEAGLNEQVPGTQYLIITHNSKGSAPFKEVK